MMAYIDKFFVHFKKTCLSKFAQNFELMHLGVRTPAHYSGIKFNNICKELQKPYK